MFLLVVTLVTFVISAMAVLSGYRVLTADSPLAERLNKLVPELAPARRAEPTVWTRARALAMRAIATLGKYGFSGSERSIGEKLSFAGIRGANAVLIFLGTRTLVSVGPAVVVIMYRISSEQPVGQTALWAALTWAVGHVLVNGWLSRRARGRIRRMTEALPDVLDLMVVSLEAGLGLNAAISRVGDERANVNDPLGIEFAQVAMEVRSGRTREDSLRGLAQRNGVEDLKALAGLIIQSDRLGASMARTLRVHADLLRTKRRQRAEETARKLPIKVLFPLALFILPPLFVVAVGPAMLRMHEVFAFIGKKR